ncbi:MAG TPA: uroporphyrinogen decarboxylase family protein [bacterium]
MKDVLTSRERFGLLVIDERPDRVNVMPLITSHAATVAGIKLKEYYTNGEAMARAQLVALEKYGHDAIAVFSEVGIIAEAMGSAFTYPENDLPVLKKGALEIKKLAGIKVPDPEKDVRLPVYLQAIEYAYAAVADRVPILAFVPAPFTTAMSLGAPDQFLIDTIRNRSQVNALLDLSLQACKEFCYAIINAGGLPVLVDPLASSSVISPRTYREFALPYEADLIRFLHRYDLDIVLHICGDTTPILELLPETHADLVSVDQVDMDNVLDKVSRDMRIIGNFNTSLLAQATPDIIARETSMMVRSAMHSPRGYVASTGCEVPIHTPSPNVRAFVMAAKEAGWY